MAFEWRRGRCLATGENERRSAACLFFANFHSKKKKQNAGRRAENASSHHDRQLLFLSARFVVVVRRSSRPEKLSRRFELSFTLGDAQREEFRRSFQRSSFLREKNVVLNSNSFRSKRSTVVNVSSCSNFDRKRSRRKICKRTFFSPR